MAVYEELPKFKFVLTYLPVFAILLHIQGVFKFCSAVLSIYKVNEEAFLKNVKILMKKLF